MIDVPSVHVYISALTMRRSSITLILLFLLLLLLLLLFSYYYYYTCIYNARKFSNGSASETLAVIRWAAW